MRHWFDMPLRTKLLAALLAAALLGGLLAAVCGSFLLNKMVINEAQRRVNLGLKTARTTLDARAHEAQTICTMIADWVACQDESDAELSSEVLEKVREKAQFDYLHLTDAKGTICVTARGDATGRSTIDSPLVDAALKQGRASSGLRLVALADLAAESAELAARAHVKVIPTPRAKQTPLQELSDAMVIEAAAPVIRPPGKVVGVVQAGVVLNRNFDLVDRVRSSIFTAGTYKGKNLGTVTIFQHDVRITTNVRGPSGERAVGTRVSAEVYDKVLGEGGVWIGPAFVVDTWYMSAYEPLRDPADDIIGILYVGVLKERYDDMHRQAMAIFWGIALAAMMAAGLLSSVLAGRLSRPIIELTRAAEKVAQGDLSCRLPTPGQAQRDEVKHLTVVFNQMVDALQRNDVQLRRSYEDLKTMANDLQRWNQNYLDTLEFITHELKNQVAAMKLNLLAVQDGYVGELSPEQREALQDVSAAIARTEEMILHYLNLSRIEKGELEVRARPVAIESDVVRPVLRDLRSQFEDRGISVQVELPEDLVAQADPSLLQVVMENLLSNAAKYGRRGGTTRVWGQRTNGWVEVHVWNEGEGVPPEKIDELFDKFSRLQPPGEQQRGTGLGLFITREIIRKHGGSIRAESAEGEWIDFIFTLPRSDVLLDQRQGESNG